MGKGSPEKSFPIFLISSPGRLGPPANTKPSITLRSTSTGVIILQAYLNVCFYSLSLPVTVRWNASKQQLQIHENRLQRVLCFVILTAVLPSQFNPMYIFYVSRELGSVESTTMTVQTFLTMGMRIIYPLYTISWVYTVVTCRSKLSTLLKMIHFEPPSTVLQLIQDDRITLCDGFRTDRRHRTLQNLRIGITYVGVIFLMMMAMFFDVKWAERSHVLRIQANATWVKQEDLDLEKAELENVWWSLRELAVYIPNIYKAWTFHVSALFFQFVFLSFLWGVCLSFREYLEKLSTPDVVNVRENYMKLKNISNQINKLVGTMVGVNASCSIPFFAVLLASLDHRNIWFIAKDSCSVVILTSALIIASDANMKAMEFREWIFEKISPCATNNDHQWTGNGNPAASDSQLHYWNLLHNDIAASPIAVKGFGFFTISYSFIGNYLSLGFIYAVIALQSQQ